MKGGRKCAEYRKETFRNHEKIPSSEMRITYCYCRVFKDFSVRKVLPSKQGLKLPMTKALQVPVVRQKGTSIKTRIETASYLSCFWRLAWSERYFHQNKD